MKKLILLLASLLFASAIFAQMKTTTVPITGFGEFALGMSPEEIADVLEKSKSSNSKVSGIFDGESTLEVTNVKSLGYLFDNCYFRFIDNKLFSIRFLMHLDKKNKSPKEFDELLSLLENDYGKQSVNERIASCVWQNEDKTLVMFTKKTDKKNTIITISVTRDILNMENMMIYK
jgi:hypothetical protein